MGPFQLHRGAARSRAALSAFISLNVRAVCRQSTARAGSGPQVLSWHQRFVFSTQVPVTTNPAIRYDGEIPVLRLTLPNGTQTAFKLSSAKPISLLLEQLREEDPSIDRIALYEMPEQGSATAVRLARSMPTEYILTNAAKHGGVLLEINNKRSTIAYPSYEERVAPIRKELAHVEEQLVPLDEKKRLLDHKAHKRGVRIAWLGLGALCAQWGLMARLTWWEYSWDVMEPISYFLGAGTGILGYMFYVVTRKEYTYETLAKVTVTRTQGGLYKRAGLDLAQYVNLKEQATQLRLRIEQIKEEYGLER